MSRHPLPAAVTAWLPPPHRLLRLAAGVLLSAGSALATADVPEAPATQRVTVHKISPAHSRATFSVRVALVRTLFGRFDFLQGEVIRQPELGTFSVDVRLAAQSLAMPNADHAAWAQSEEFFDALRHPWIRFFAEHLPERLLSEGGELTGELSLRGVTRSVSFELQPSSCEQPGLDCDVVAEGELERSEFGMKARRLFVSDNVSFGLRLRIEEGAPGIAPLSSGHAQR